MRWTRTLRLRFRSLLRSGRVERELDEELQYHLDRLIESCVAAGMTREDACALARREMGGIEQRKEECRDARGLRWADSLVQDLRYGCRVLRRHPGFALIASLTLALGIGANTAIFTLVNAVLIAPLPYRSPRQLVSITGAFPTGAVAAMREELRTMEPAAYAEGHEFTLTGTGEAVHLIGARVSAELFAVLGVLPRLGRPFYSGEDRAGHDNLVILSQTLWQERFAAAPDIIGLVIELDGTARRIVGVMP
jgi:putative ABC transport system permease protein